MTKALRVAIFGAGPAGIYAGNILAGAYENVTIDLFDSLPAPYGLIRYGVAPDHPRIKGIVNSLHEMLDSGKIRLKLEDVSLDKLLDELELQYRPLAEALAAPANLIDGTLQRLAHEAVARAAGADVVGGLADADVQGLVGGVLLAVGVLHRAVALRQRDEHLEIHALEAPAVRAVLAALAADDGRFQVAHAARRGVD